VKPLAASVARVPRVALLGIVALVAAFAFLMVVRVGVLGGSTQSSAPSVPVQPVRTSASPTSTPSTSFAKPQVVLLPGLPAGVARALRVDKVVVVSLYVGQAAGDRTWVREASDGARAAGAGFAAVNVGSDRTAVAVGSFAGPVSPPAVLVVKRPGKIVSQISGPVDSAVVRQAAHNAGARR